MGVAQLTGRLTAGPPSSGSGVFPTSLFSDDVQLGTAGKSFQASGSSVSRTISSPSSFVAIGDVGSTGDVTRADFLYLRSDGELTVELTTDDGSGGDVVAVVPTFGLLVIEFQSAKYLKGLRVKGSARISYFVSGQQ